MQSQQNDSLPQKSDRNSTRFNKVSCRDSVSYDVRSAVRSSWADGKCKCGLKTSSSQHLSLVANGKWSVNIILTDRWGGVGQGGGQHFKSNPILKSNLLGSVMTMYGYDHMATPPPQI